MSGNQVTVQNQIQNAEKDFNEAIALGPGGKAGLASKPEDIAEQGTLVRNAYNTMEWCFEQLLAKCGIPVDVKVVDGQHQFHDSLLNTLGDSKTPKEIRDTLGKGPIVNVVGDLRRFRNQWKTWNTSTQGRENPPTFDPQTKTSPFNSYEWHGFGDQSIKRGEDEDSGGLSWFRK